MSSKEFEVRSRETGVRSKELGVGSWELEKKQGSDNMQNSYDAQAIVE